MTKNECEGTSCSNEKHRDKKEETVALLRSSLGIGVPERLSLQHARSNVRNQKETIQIG